MCGCVNHKYKGWQTIEMIDCGTLKIPEDWSCFCDEDGLMHIMNGEKLALLQFNKIPDTEIKYGYLDTQYDHYDKYYGNAHIYDMLERHDCSYDALLYKNKYDVGEIYELYFGCDDSWEPQFTFVVCDETLTKNFLIKLCNSYIKYYPEHIEAPPLFVSEENINPRYKDTADRGLVYDFFKYIKDFLDRIT